MQSVTNKATKSLKLISSDLMPLLGLGTWKSSKGEVRKAAEAAIDAGYRHIDCAFVYGNEAEVGQGVQVKIKEGVVKRKDLFITSKLWNIFHHPDDVKPALQKSLELLQMDYLDLYLIHWPQGYVRDKGLYPKDENGKFIYSDCDYIDTWKAMEEVNRDGLARNIGLSNFNMYQIKRIMRECSVVPANVQIESHPYLTNDELIRFCHSNKITVTAYSPLGSADRPWAKDGEPVLLEDPKIVEIASRLGKTPAQVVLRYQIQRDVIVIPKSVTPSRIRSNKEIFDFELTDEDMKTIGSFNKNFRGCKLEWISDHKYWPFTPGYTE